MDSPLLSIWEQPVKIPCEVLKQHLLRLGICDLAVTLCLVAVIQEYGKQDLSIQIGSSAASVVRLVMILEYGSSQLSMVAMSAGLSLSVLAMISFDTITSLDFDVVLFAVLVLWSAVCCCLELIASFICLAAYRERSLYNASPAERDQQTTVDSCLMSHNDRFSAVLAIEDDMNPSDSFDEEKEDADPRETTPTDTLIQQRISSEDSTNAKRHSASALVDIVTVRTARCADHLRGGINVVKRRIKKRKEQVSSTASGRGIIRDSSFSSSPDRPSSEPSRTTLVEPAGGRGWTYARHLPGSVYSACLRAMVYYCGLACIAILGKSVFGFIVKILLWRSRILLAFIIIAWVYSNIYYLLFLFFPWPQSEFNDEWKNDPQFLSKIGVVVPCHNSALEIGQTLESLLKYFEPNHIVICDNGNSPAPTDNTRDVIREICVSKGWPRDAVHYHYIPEGLKTQALGIGALALAAIGADRIEYILHIDDDTILSDRMVFDESLFLKDPKVAAVAFARTTPANNVVTAYVDFFYKRSDHFGYLQAKLCTRPYIPGPCGLWKLNTYLEMMRTHPCLPFGEDIFGSYHSLIQGYRFEQELRCTVLTFAPPVLHAYTASLCGGTFEDRVQGYGAASIWKQRAHRWTVSGCRIFPLSFYAFLTYCSSGTYYGAIFFRLFRLRDYKSLIFNLVYPLYLLYLFIALKFTEVIIQVLIFKFIFLFVSLLRNFFINYVCWRRRPHIQVSLGVILLSPLMDAFTAICAVFGRWKCLLYYIPLVPMRTGLVARLQVTISQVNKRVSFSSASSNIQKVARFDSAGDKREQSNHPSSRVSSGRPSSTIEDGTP